MEFMMGMTNVVFIHKMHAVPEALPPDNVGCV
jgi:hypothetical protein